MPLNTEIIRDDKRLQMPHGWSDFHVACMIIAASLDGPEPGVFKRNTDKPDFKYNDKEETPDHLRGKTGADYPDVPCPITVQERFHLTNYGFIAMTPLSHEGYVLKGEHKFLDVETEEVLHLLPGDRLVAYRTMKG